jgi:anti-sigma factor ChrR (cupin superfamily)
MSTPIGVYDSDEAFWREIRALPPEVKDGPGMHEMFMFKSQVQMLNRNIEDAIRLRLAGWSASLPSGRLQIDRVFAWQWRRPGPRGGRLFLSTQQAITALQKEQSLLPQDSLDGIRAENAVKIGGGAPV